MRVLRVTPQLHAETTPLTEAFVHDVERRAGAGGCREVAPEDQAIQ